MRLFLDASVLLAAAGSSNGSSRTVFSYAQAHGWLLPYKFLGRERAAGRLTTAK